MAQVSTLFGGADITPSTFARIIVAVHDSQSMTADSKHPQRYMFHLFRIGCSRRGAQDRVVMLRTFRQFWMPPCHLETRADFIPEGERKLSDIPLSPFHRPAFLRMSLSRASWTHCTQHGASRFRGAETSRLQRGSCLCGGDLSMGAGDRSDADSDADEQTRRLLPIGTTPSPRSSRTP
jgi:hypothetical protein